MKFLIKYFKRISVHDTMEEELYRAQLDLLKGQTMFEYANAEVSYNSARVKRLERQLNDFKTIINKEKV